MPIKRILAELEKELPLPNPKCNYHIYFDTEKQQLKLVFVIGKFYECTLSDEVLKGVDKFLQEIKVEIKQLLNQQKT